jgi:hypothetical protein
LAPRWTESRVDRGVTTYKLRSWEYFAAFVDTEFLDFRDYIYRGQASAEWKLEPTLDRVLRTRKMLNTPKARPEHLERYQIAASGRRG